MNSLLWITDRSTSLLKRPYLMALFATGAAMLLACGVWSALASAANTPLPAPENLRFVRVAPVLSEPELERLRLPGLLRAADTAELAFLEAGHLAERRVTRGQQVAAGDILGLLYNPSLTPGLNAADARLNEVRTQLEQLEREQRRVQDLHERGLLPTEELERIVARRDSAIRVVDQAEAQRRQASEQLTEASLRAPFAGTVIDVFAEPGEFVAAGQPVLALAGNGRLEVILDLGAERAGRLQPGQTARVRGSDGSSEHQATVVEIGLGQPGRPAPVRLRMDASPPDWRPGLGVTVELSFNGAGRMSVPLSAVVDPGSGQPRVFRIRDDQASLVPVALGPVRADRVLIDGPLVAGDEVVIAGHGQLLDQESVRVLR